MISFANDYGEGAHEKILKRLAETNRESLPGYGTDHYSESAKKKICQACGCPNGNVFFLVGGTQTNAIVIGALLERHQGVVAKLDLKIKGSMMPWMDYQPAFPASQTAVL